MPEKGYCPNCKTDRELIRIVYGSPTKGDELRSMRDEALLGGDPHGKEIPLYACRICGRGLPEYGVTSEEYLAEIRRFVKTPEMQEFVKRPKVQELLRELDKLSPREYGKFRRTLGRIRF